MSLTIGIIGLTQAGKTTLFHALTRLDTSDRQSNAAKPNLARVSVPDSRLDRLAAIYNPKKTTPATVDFMDVAANLGDAEEKGALGKRVLGTFRTVDALLEVVRCFDHPYLGAPKAAADLETLELEKIISDLTIIENTLDRNKKMAPDAKAYFESLREPLLEGRKPTPDLLDKVPESARPLVQSMALLIAKPTIICANIPESALGQEKDHTPTQEVLQWARERGVDCFTVSARTEEEISRLSPEETQEFMSELGIATSGLDKLIAASYRSLNLMTFFTSGEDECRAWTVRRGAMAPEAAGKIHTDLEKGFIRAEVVSCDEFLQLGSTSACRDKGLLRLEGKTYPVQDGDIMEIRFNV